MTGNIEVAGYPFNTCMWAGESIKGHSLAWWPYEQTAYYLDGAHRLGLLLNDKRLLRKVNDNIRYVLEHITKSGRYGTQLSEQWWRWPYASFNRLFMTEYEITGDQLYIDTLKNHYLTFSAHDFSDDLELANLEELCWLYGQTKDEHFLQMAEEAYTIFKSDIKNRNRHNGRGYNSDIQFGTDMVPNHHGVVYLELVKIPTILYSYTGKKEYLHEAMNGIEMMEKHHMLVSGLPSSTEHFEGVSEVSGHETCNSATLPYTYGFLLRVNGDAVLGDKIEKAIFNGAMGSITKDFKAHQYFSAPNQMISTLHSNPFGHHPARMAYLPGHDVECCTGNVNRFMPYYVEQMWLRSHDKGVVASLFGPTTVTTKVGIEDTSISITEETNYPFSDQIIFKLEMEESVEFPFYIRIPAWCENPHLAVNGIEIKETYIAGTFHKLERIFANQDIVTLTLPMKVKTSHCVVNGMAIERGPLVYSFPIEACETNIDSYEKASSEFPALERRPNTVWNYAMASSANQVESLEVISRPISGFPWDIE
ncbi:MAG: beta-L-arabinofuranosidase domain-containing protein, partial [Turicibacter sp.]